MNTLQKLGARLQGGSLLRTDFVFAVGVFVAGLLALILALASTGSVLPQHGWPTPLLFFIFALFSITMGYPHPSFGYVSFDRVAQVASILVLGPVDAAWINGLASLVYPWRRIKQAVPLRAVAMAALNNAGMMTIVVLAGGLLYVALGGVVPLQFLTLAALLPLFVLVATMQASNDLVMLAVVWSRQTPNVQLFNPFSISVEATSACIGILVAVIFNRMELSVVTLLLAILALGMFVLKRFAEMRQRLETLVEKRTQALKAKSLELERQATHDQLTGLVNRRFADEYLQRETENSRRYGRDFAIAMADIDWFKSINDTHSHAMGDEVLRKVAHTLRTRCRKTDVIARYGGEEFLLCFPETDRNTAISVCEQLRAAIEEDAWDELGTDMTVTLSFGVAASQPDGSVQRLMSVADERLYDAKDQGRNRVNA